MSEKLKGTPDSDETARKRVDMDDVDDTDVANEDVDMQTNNKSGKHSAVEKLAASRPEFGSSPGAHPVDGAFGNAESAEDSKAKNQRKQK